MSRKRLAVAAAAFFVVLAIWYVALWSPQGASLQKAKLSATATLQKEVTLKAQVASLQKQRSQVPAFRAQLAQLNQSLPANAEVDKVIDDVNAVVLKSGVTLSSLTTPIAVGKVAIGGTGAIPLNMTMSVSGTYSQLIEFINQINAMPRLTVVDSFGLTEPDKSGKILTTITARVFMTPPAAASTTPTTTVAVAR
jgi:Tfp pilus assembly protein PilO